MKSVGNDDGRVRVEDYLVLEHASRYRHEFVRGVVYPIQGEVPEPGADHSATRADLIRNFGFALHSRMRHKPCGVKIGQMRLRVGEASGSAVVPDVLVHCRPVEFPASTIELAEARLVMDVLTPDTQARQGGLRLAAYRGLPGLQHIVLINSQEQQAFACHRDTPEGEWQPMLPWARGTALQLHSLGLEIPWGEIYDGVGLD